MKTTKDHIKYWQNRRIDWGKSYFTPDHPHRKLLISLLNRKRFSSVFEIGCAAGANLYAIGTTFPGVEIGGCDINRDAIIEAQKHFKPTTFLDVGPAHKIFLADHSIDVTISDMTLIYYSPWMIRKVFKEIERITKKYIILCEFHHKSWLKRQQLRWNTGYNAYNYKKILEKRGYHDIEVFKIPEEYWPGGEPQKTFGYFITATLP